MRKQVDYWASFEENFYYHIYNRSINRETIFIENKHYNFFLKKCKTLILPFFRIEAYCILPNHYHLLVQVKIITAEIKEEIKRQGTAKSMKYQEGKISYNEFLVDQFKRLFQSYSVWFNLLKNRSGSVFQKRFKRILIKDEYKWKHILAYIHHNPIHHKLETNYLDWKYSSYASFLSNNPTSISREQVLIQFDEDLEIARKKYLEFHQCFKMEKEMNDLYLDPL